MDTIRSLVKRYQLASVVILALFLAVVLPLVYWGWRLVTHRPFGRARLRITAWAVGVVGACAFLSAMPRVGTWPTTTGLRLDVLVMLRSTELSTLMVLVLLPGTLSV